MSDDKRKGQGFFGLHVGDEIVLRRDEKGFEIIHPLVVGRFDFHDEIVIHKVKKGGEKG